MDGLDWLLTSQGQALTMDSSRTVLNGQATFSDFATQCWASWDSASTSPHLIVNLGRPRTITAVELIPGGRTDPCVHVGMLRLEARTSTPSLPWDRSA